MVRKLALIVLVLAAATGAKAWHDTMRDPVVVRHTLSSAALPAGSAPVTIALLADIHVAGPDMPPERLDRIVDQVNALRPDIIAIAGDLVSEKRTATHIYTPREIIAPLARLKARHGVILVPGNHDHWFGWPALSKELAQLPYVRVLTNQATQAGPVAFGGVDDDFTGRADTDRTIAAMERLTGPRVMLTHSPDIFPATPGDIDLVLAGHTHCGQIAYPWGGSPATMSDYGNRYACGVVQRGRTTLITSGGIGTSLLPIRLFTQPQVWLIEIGPPQQ